MIAASSMFAQTANPSKPNPKVSNQSNITKPMNPADAKGAGVNNPVGKNGGNKAKPVSIDKVNIKKTGATTTTTTIKKD